jgi:hypothetical protein
MAACLLCRLGWAGGPSAIPIFIFEKRKPLEKGCSERCAERGTSSQWLRWAFVSRLGAALKAACAPLLAQ